MQKLGSAGRMGFSRSADILQEMKLDNNLEHQCDSNGICGETSYSNKLGMTTKYHFGHHLWLLKSIERRRNVFCTQIQPCVKAELITASQLQLPSSHPVSPTFRIQF